jgi:hypothetical protein
MWRESFPDLESAKSKARQLALDEGLEFFVFNCRDSTEVAQFFPNPGTPRAQSVENPSLLTLFTLTIPEWTATTDDVERREKYRPAKLKSKTH